MEGADGATEACRTVGNPPRQSRHLHVAWTTLHPVAHSILASSLLSHNICNTQGIWCYLLTKEIICDLCKLANEVLDHHVTYLAKPERYGFLIHVVLIMS